MQELRVINDYVMGGRSRSKLIPTPTGPLFGGDVSLSNGGGFASFRTPLRLPPNVVALQIAHVRAFGLLIGEGQSGPFRVELELPLAG
jgi:hypothetical protein